jgi:hypothetical protein
LQNTFLIYEKDKENIVFAYLYGSFVRNKKYAKDIDIAIFVKGKIKPNFERKLAARISKEIGKDVEVIILNDKPLLFISEVLKNCKLIFSRNEKSRVKYESFMLGQIQSFNELMKEYDLKRFERYGIR